MKTIAIIVLIVVLEIAAMFWLAGCATQPMATAPIPVSVIESAAPKVQAMLAQPLVISAPKLPPSFVRAPYAIASWQPSPDTNIADYIVYYGATPGLREQRIDAGTNLSLVVATNLWYGETAYFQLSAVTVDGLESDAIAAEPFVVPRIIEAHLNPLGNHLQASSDLRTWSPRDAVLTSNAWLIQIDPNAPQEFFRSLNL